MGAWGTGAFENDDALDWVWGLDGDDADEVVAEALHAVAAARPETYLEVTEGANAIAACHIIAGLLDSRTDGLPPEAIAYLDRRPRTPDAALVTSAIAALDRVGATDSEVAELWDETDDGPSWRASLADLRERLAGYV